MDQEPGRSDSQFHSLSSSRIVMEQAVSPTPVTRTPNRADGKDKPRRFDAPNRLEIITGIIVTLFLLGFPWLNPGYRILCLSITTAFTAVALHGLALQFGQAGIMSVGHSAVMGIGAYTAAILATKLGVGFWVALPLSALLSALVAGLIGLPSLRVNGQHYIIITFCFCALLVIALTNGGSFTGAPTGLDTLPFDPLFAIFFILLTHPHYL